MNWTRSGSCRSTAAATKAPTLLLNITPSELIYLFLQQNRQQTAATASLVEAAIENQIIRLLNKAIVADDRNYDALIDEALDHILHVCQSTFSQAAPPIWQKHRTIQDRSGQTRYAKQSKKLHEFGIIWGDGKPSNVIVDQSGDAWLIDFAGGWS